VPSRAEVLAVIGACCRDDDPKIRHAALSALPRMRYLPEGWVERVVAGLDDEHPDVRQAAAAAVYRLYVQRQQGYSHHYVRASLGFEYNIDLRDLIDHLIATLADKDPKIRLAAAQSLRVLGQIATKALPQLRELSESDDESIAKEAADAVRWIERTPDSGPAVRPQPVPNRIP
jgi:HEAT repeat protein